VTDRDILRALGANVKAARAKANLTQECLAELVGVHWQTISNLENGRASIPITTFAKISQALEMSPNRLLEGLPEPDRRRFDKIKLTLARKRNRLFKL
jgi:DNA-binding XRE family transcriptional regulator